MQTIRLNNGIEMPLLGYGLFQVPPQEAERCTRDALRLWSKGYHLGGLLPEDVKYIHFPMKKQ